MASMRGRSAAVAIAGLKTGTTARRSAKRRLRVEREKKTVRVNEFITVSERADLKIPPFRCRIRVQESCLMVTIKQRLDFDQTSSAGEVGVQPSRKKSTRLTQHRGGHEDTAEQLERVRGGDDQWDVDHGKSRPRLHPESECRRRRVGESPTHRCVPRRSSGGKPITFSIPRATKRQQPCARAGQRSLTSYVWSSRPMIGEPQTVRRSRHAKKRRDR